MTPHIHATGASSEVYSIDVDKDQNGWFGRLKAMFAQDLGEGHLEHCITADKADLSELLFVPIDFNPISSQDFLSSRMIEDTYTDLEIPPILDHSDQRFYLSPRLLRGPPITL